LLIVILVGASRNQKVKVCNIYRHNYPEDESISERGKKLAIKNDKPQDVQFSSQMPSKLKLPSLPPKYYYWRHKLRKKTVKL
jgi:hypothetical protein